MPALPPHELLEVRNLNVSYHDSAGSKPAVVDVDLTIRAGECLAIVGESGSGKSTVALSAMDLLSHNASLRANIAFEGVPLDRLNRERRRLLNGGDIGMVFQSPMSTLNPLRTVGSQIAQTLRIHQPDLSRKERYDRVDELLHKVGIPDPKRRSAQYPHQFSGGMLQRVVIAMAIANQPKLLIADEPTTALDVTVQAQIIALLRIAAVEANAALLLISHDLGLVSELADRVAVMYAGRIVEEGPMSTILTRPKHPYTQGLLATAAPTAEPGQVLPAIPGTAPQPGAIGIGCPFQPRCPVGRNREICGNHPPLANVGEQHRSACHFPEERAHYEIATDRSDAPGTADETSLEVRDIEVVFPIKSRILRRTMGSATVLRGVDLDVGVGETVAIVGETGSGKTTLARTIVGLQDQDAGTIRFPSSRSGNPAGRLEKARRAQMVFQDPKGSLNPRIKVRSAIAEPLQAHGLDAGRERINELLEMVGLSEDSSERYPHQLSGGQQQRVCIARALAVEPNVLVLDEPVSALDVSIQAQILNLLIDIQRRVGVSYVLIAHDLSMVAQIAHRVAVMYLGRFVEIGDAEVVLTNPQHPYTQALLAAVPEGPTGNRTLEPPVRGEPPSPLEVIPGCAFRTRCPMAFESCKSIDPSLATTELGSKAACLLIEGADK